MSHIEIFNAGQPRLARYPVHWHHAGYVGQRSSYADPSEVDSLSIHNSFSRFVTIHGTHEATVRNVVGYNGVGHGFFLEDGYETQNKLIGNLGVHIKNGIILPSERHRDICLLTNDGYPGVDSSQWARGQEACNGLSMFWIANIENFLDDNASGKYDNRVHL